MLPLIFLIAFFFRLIGLNQSLWLDEATTAKVVSHFSFTQIITVFSPTDFHPPFFYLFMKVWTSLFGLSGWSLRFPSVIFSLLTGYVVYRIGKKLKNEKTGLWAASIFLFNPLIMYYSQEARMYLMATFFLTSALYFYLFLEAPKPKLSHIILCNVFIFLSFISFYGSAFFISAFYIYLLIDKKFKQFFYIHLGFLLPLLVLSPLLFKQLTNAKEAMKVVVNWSQVLGQATLKNLFLIPLKFSIGRISFEPKSLYYLVSVPWSLFIWFLTLRQATKYRMLLFLLIFPLALGLVFSVFTPLLQYFRFIYLVPIMCLLLALTVKNNALKGIVLTGFVIFSLIYLLFPQFHRDDWQTLSAKLSGSANVYIIPSSADALIYYRPNIKVLPLFDIHKETAHELTVIPYTSEIYGFDYRSILGKNQYKLIKTTSYRGLTVEKYSK